LIRKVCSIMRRMLLAVEEYRWIEHQVFERKMKECHRMLTQTKEERKNARSES
jgi:hypothetical protein